MVTVLARGFGSCLQAILLVLFARAVDQTLFGLTNALLGLGAIAAVLADLGITAYIVRTWSFDRDPQRVVRALRVGNSAALVLGLVLTAAFATASVAVDAPLYLSFIAAWISFEKCTEAYLSVHSAEQRTLIPAVSIILRRALPLAVFAGLLFFSVDALLALVIALCLGGLVGQLHGYYALPKFLRVKTTALSARVVLSECRAFGIAALASQIRNADTFLVSLFAGLAASGAFAAAMKLTIPIYLVASAVALSIMPGIAKAGMKAVLRIAVILVSGGCLGVVGLVAVRPWMDPVMTWIYGPAYSGSGLLLCLVLCGTFIGAVGFPLAALLQALNLTRTVAQIEVAGALMVVAGIAAGAVLGEAVGAAVGALVAQSVRAALLIVRLLIWRSTSVSPKEVSREGVAP
ncbi:oligosaccharide flippase family protein [Arthrobacter sp. S13_S34]|nr:oligosaccharide flippase family protein [Arthrobacter sp. S13_S34]